MESDCTHWNSVVGGKVTCAGLLQSLSSSTQTSEVQIMWLGLQEDTRFLCMCGVCVEARGQQQASSLPMLPVLPTLFFETDLSLK